MPTPTKNISNRQVFNVVLSPILWQWQPWNYSRITKDVQVRILTFGLVAYNPTTLIEIVVYNYLVDGVRRCLTTKQNCATADNCALHVYSLLKFMACCHVYSSAVNNYLLDQFLMRMRDASKDRNTWFKVDFQCSVNFTCIRTWINLTGFTCVNEIRDDVWTAYVNVKSWKFSKLKVFNFLRLRKPFIHRL